MEEIFSAGATKEDDAEKSATVFTFTLRLMNSLTYTDPAVTQCSCQSLAH